MGSLAFKAATYKELDSDLGCPSPSELNLNSADALLFFQ